MNSFKQSNLSKTTNKLVGRLEQLSKLKEIANRKNYPYKVKLLHAKIKEQYEFWEKKEHSNQAKVSDLKKDLNFITSQLDSTEINVERVVILEEKYGCK